MSDARIGTISIGFAANTKGLTKGIKGARKSIASLPTATSAARIGFAKLALSIAAVAGPLIVISKIFGGFFRAMESLDRVGKFADQVGLSVDELRSLQLGATLSGTSVANLEKGLQRLTREIGMAKTGMTEGKMAFDALGLSADQLGNMTTYDSLNKIADAIQRQPDAATKAASAYAIFGRQGAEMITFLDAGSEGLDAFKAKLLETQGSISRTDVSQIEKANDAIAILGGIIESVYHQLAIQLSPFITAAAEEFQNMGLTGENAGNFIANAIEFVAKGIAFAMDIVDAFGIAWLGVKKMVTDVTASILRATANMAMSLQKLINKIPGVEVSFGSSIERMADKAEEESARIGKELNDRLIAPSAGEKVTRFFNKIRNDAKKTRDELGKKPIVPAPNEANADALKQIFDLKDQLKIAKGEATQFGIEMEKLAANGATQGLIDQLKKVKTELDLTQQLADQRKAMEDHANSIKESLTSPFDAFKNRQQELQELSRNGLLNGDQLKKATMAALPDNLSNLLQKELTPLQQFQKDLKEASQYFDAGVISKDQFATVKENLRKELGDINPQVKFGGVAELGSQEARDSILRHRFQKTRNDDPLVQIEKQGQEGNKLLIQIARNTKKGDEVFSLN